MSGQSFAEKYRGTEWESPEAAAAAGKPPAGHGASRAHPGAPVQAAAEPATFGAQSGPASAGLVPSSSTPMLPTANPRATHDGATPIAAQPTASRAGSAATAATAATGTAAAATPGADAKPAGRNRRTLAIVVVALVAIGGTAAGAAALALSNSPAKPGGNGSNAAGALVPGSTPAPSASGSVTDPAVPGASAGPVPGGSAAPNASPAAPIETQAQTGKRILAAFDARMLVPDIAYKLSGKGAAKTNKGTLSWTRTCTVAGASSSCRYVEKTSIKGYSQKLASRTVAVGMQLWAKSGGSGWKRTRAAGAYRYSPFLDIVQAREFAYAGTVTRDGARLHRLLSTADYHPSITKWGGVVLRGVLLGKPSMEILVRDDGTPVSARFTYTARGGGLRVNGSADWTFSSVGSTSLKVTPPN